MLARDIHVPMLIIHSEEDFRCPINQAEELWVTLRLLGRDVTFYRFPGENHELSRSGSPVHRKQRAEIILDFFAEKLRVDPLHSPELRLSEQLFSPTFGLAGAVMLMPAPSEKVPSPPVPPQSLPEMLPPVLSA